MIRVIKPMKLGLLHRVFEDAGKPIFTATVMAYFPLGERKRLFHEVPMWKAAAEQLGPETPIDMAMPKTRGEVIVAGKAFVVGEPKPATNVRIKVGPIDKELYVVGDRRWEASGMSMPVPFNEMPLTWDRAFGGPAFAANPLGRGHAPVDVGGQKVHLLPNVEHPKHLVRSPSDKPAPVGTTPIDQTWPTRASKVGTYDAKWQKTRFPWFPEDFDWEFFNVAPEDQRLPAFFAGDEEIVIDGMHPTKRVVRGHLPSLVARVFVVRRAAPGQLVEITTHLDTVIVLPNIERGIAVFRGSLPITEDDGHDITHVLGAFEDPNEPKKSVEHYKDVLEKREDREKAAMYALRDKDLLPAWPKDPTGAPEEQWSDHPALVKTEELARVYFDRKVDSVYEEAKQAALDNRMPALPDERKTADFRPPPEDLDELAEYFEEVLQFADEKRKEAEKMRDDALEQARAELATQGLDLDDIRRKAEEQGGGPPYDVLASKQFARVEETIQMGRNSGADVSKLVAQLHDPTFRSRIEETERVVFESYRRYTHFFPPSATVAEPVRAERRARAVAALDSRSSLRGFDLTGADLTGLDLSGADLEDAMLEGADLTGVRLVGARLAGSTLCRAKLAGADLSDADLARSNLSQTKLEGTKLDGAKLDDVWFWETEFAGASLRRIKLGGNALFGAKGGAADFSESTFELMNILEIDFRGSVMVGMTIKLTSFLRAKLDGVDLSRAKLKQVGFVECSGEGAVFDGADIERVVFALGSSFPKSRFVGAKVSHSSLRGCDFSEADMSDATLDECDFGETNLRKANLHHASAEQSLFMRADLRDADLRGAKLVNALMGRARVEGADLRGANLFRADMAKVRGDDRTNLKDAYVAQVRVVPEPDQRKVIP